MEKDPFEEYIKENELSKRDKGYVWQTAIGLQAVDGLKTSDYLMQTAIRNIEEEISLDEANKLLETYYKENPTRADSDRTEEADKVSVRLPLFFLKRPLVFRQTSIYLFIESYLVVSILMLA